MKICKRCGLPDPMNEEDIAKLGIPAIEDYIRSGKPRCKCDTIMTLF